VYQIENSGDLVKLPNKWRTGRATWPHVSRTVLLLGLTSFFTDISSEMVSSILPLYMILTLRMAPMEFGVIDGLYQGTASLVRVAGGYIADRWCRYKEAAVVGYALSAVCKLGVLLRNGCKITFQFTRTEGLPRSAILGGPSQRRLAGVF